MKRKFPLTVFSLTCILTLFQFPSLLAQPPCHPSGPSAATAVSRPQGPIGASSTGKFTQVYGNTDWQIDPIDSVGLLFDFLGRYALSRTRNGVEGDPLGTGGKSLTLQYSPPTTGTSSANESIFGDNTAPDKLGYLPNWPSSILSGRIDGRIAESMKFSSSLYFSPPASSDDTGSGSWGFSELCASWLPALFPGLSIKGGRFASSGSYFSIFDQDMLGATSLQGIGLRHGRALTKRAISETEILYGVNPFLSEKRQFGIAKSRFIFHDRYQARIFAGVQSTGIDSAANIPEEQLLGGNSFGWHAGIEALHRGDNFSHKLAYTYGTGDVILGFGAPSWVQYESPGPDSTAKPIRFFSRKGSSISNLAYTLAFHLGKLSVETGLWGVRNIPDRNEILDTNYNTGVSSLFLRENGLDAGDSIRLQTEPFSSAKFSILPTVQVNQRIRIGLRYVRLHFFEPLAKANWQSALITETLDPLTDPTGSRILYGPARRELEGVNAHVVSPQMEMDLLDWLHFSMSYTKGFYEKEIVRQGEISKEHANFSVALLANYHFFRKLDKSMKSPSN